MICIESLDLYTINKIEELDKFYPRYRNLILFLIRSNNDTRYNNQTNQTLEDYLQCIYLINKLIQNPTTQNIAHDLLCRYYKNPDELLIRQYINKFTYQYNTTQDFYNIKSCVSTLEINEIAIYCLYIIQKIYLHKQSSLKYLTNYLCL